MHRVSPVLLGAFLALAGCQKSPSPTAQALPKAAPLAVTHSVPAVLDAGAPLALRPAPRVPVPVLALAHVDHAQVDHLLHAQALKDEGDGEEALAEARRQLADAPEDEDAMSLVAHLAQALGQTPLAAAAFEALAAVREDDAVPLVQAARLHLVLDDSEGAARLASAALGRDEGNVEAQQVLGRAALMDGDLRRAMDALEQARALDPNHGWVLNNLGFAYLRANENAEAAEVLGRAAELLPAAAVVQNNLGVALERLGRREEANAAYERSASLAPHYTRALVNRSRLALLRTEDAGASSEPEPDADSDADVTTR